MHIAAGAFFGGVIGGGLEAVRQYRAEGKISDWGKVGGAAAGGAVSGALTAAVPGSGVLGVAATNGMGSAAGGVVDRAVASGGKDLGTLADVKRDAVMGAVTGVGGKYAGQAVSKVKPKLSVPAAPKPSVSTPLGPNVSAVPSGAVGGGAKAAETGGRRFIVDPKGNALIEPPGGTTVGNPAGTFLETRFPNGSPAQQLHGPHRSFPQSHGHGFKPGAGPNQRGPSLDALGNEVPYDSPAAHWPVNK